MSQDNPKYKRLEALLSDAKQVKPEPDHAPGDQDTATLKVQIPQPDAKPVVQESETLKPELEENLAEAQRKTIVSRPIPKKVETKPVTHPAANEIQGNEQKARNAFLIATAIAVAHFVAVLYYLYLGRTIGSAQFYALAAISFGLGVLFVLGAILSRRGQPTLGMILTLGVLSASYPPIATLASGLGLVLGLALMVVGPMSAFQVLPRKSGRVITILTILAGLATVLLDVFGSTTRPSLPGIVVQLLAVSVVGLTAFFIVRQFREYSLRTKLLIPIYAAAVVIALGVIAGNLYITTRQNRLQEAERLTRTQQIFSDHVQNLETLALGLATETANNPEVQAAFAAGDRERMLEIMMPTFQTLKEQFAIKQFHFVSPPAITFVRLHKPEDYGDDLSGFRPTVVTANNERRPVRGAEIGRNGLGLRGVVPINYQGRYVGVLDVGVDLGATILEGIKQQYGMDAQILLDRKATDAVDYHPAEAAEGTQPPDGFLLHASTITVPFFADISDYQLVLSGETVISQQETDGRNYSRISFPLLDFAGNVIGVVDLISDETAAVAAVNRTLVISILAILAVISIASYLLVRLINSTMRPVGELTEVATAIAGGEQTRRIVVKGRDELAILAGAFNSMTDQLQDLIGSLEQRVTERTQDLELASEVGRAVTEKVANRDDMLTTAAEMIRARFGLYYTQVYLTDPAGQVLLLRAGTGDVGEALLKRGHRLIIDSNSLNGRAALDMKPVIVTDTLKNPNFKPNPLLPKTRSEMAMPLISGNRILGILDMQSEQPGTLSEANLPAFEALAGQLAIAIQNSELFTETEQARAEIESQARRLTRTGWMDYMDAIHRPEQTSYVFAENQIVTLHGAETPPAANSNALSLPLEITGEPIGAINVELENGAWTTERKELVQRVARQVAQQVENLRLLETAERYREEAEKITRRLTHEGWEEYTETLEEGPLGFAYDLGEVVSLKGDGHQDSSQSLAIPLSVREEAIGQLTVNKDVSTEEAHEIIQTVASRLSSHIENLRLSEQNERRAAELEQAVNRLRELDRLKSSFLANMSHELRTPLNSILGFADVILEELDGPLTANMQNDLGLIQKNGQHLLHLINDVLDMAKIEAGRMNFNIEKFRVHEILDEVTSITSTLASEKNLALFIESDSDREMEILADRTRLRQVMINLVNNSIKFTDKGKISIRASREGDHVLIRVKDTGIGIPADKLDEVFNEFAQVDTSTTRKAGGTGLGLPISRKLIEMHGGRLWAESSGVENEGSTFYVELPIEAQLAEPAEKLEK